MKSSVAISNDAVEAVAVRKKRKFNTAQLQFLILALPAIILIFVFNYLPMSGIVIAFKNFKFARGIFASEWVGLENFRFFFKSNDALRVIRNTLLYNACFIVADMVFPVTFAIFLSQIRSKLAIKGYQTSIFLPYFLSWVVISYMTLSFFDYNSGMFNMILQKNGKEMISWYSQSKYWPFIFIFFHVWKDIGYKTLVYYASIIGIDTSIYEAARTDGCSEFKSIFRITVPMIRGTIIMLAILQVGSIFRADFGLFYQLPQNSGALMNVSDVVDTYIFRTLMVTGNTSVSAAVGLVQSVVGLILVLLTNYIVGRIDSDSTLF